MNVENTEPSERTSSDGLAFALAILGGIICGSILPITWVFAPMFWLFFCLTLPFVPCAIAREKVVAVGAVANVTMCVACLITSLMMSRRQFSETPEPTATEFSFWSFLMENAPYYIFMVVAGALLSRVASSLILKRRAMRQLKVQTTK